MEGFLCTHDSVFMADITDEMQRILKIRSEEIDKAKMEISTEKNQNNDYK